MKIKKFLPLITILTGTFTYASAEEIDLPAIMNSQPQKSLTDDADVKTIMPAPNEQKKVNGRPVIFNSLLFGADIAGKLEAAHASYTSILATRNLDEGLGLKVINNVQHYTPPPPPAPSVKQIYLGTIIYRSSDDVTAWVNNEKYKLGDTKKDLTLISANEKEVRLVYDLSKYGYNFEDERLKDHPDVVVDKEKKTLTFSLIPNHRLDIDVMEFYAGKYYPVQKPGGSGLPIGGIINNVQQHQTTFQNRGPIAQNPLRPDNIALPQPFNRPGMQNNMGNQGMNPNQMNRPGVPGQQGMNQNNQMNRPGMTGQQGMQNNMGQQGVNPNNQRMTRQGMPNPQAAASPINRQGVAQPQGMNPNNQMNGQGMPNNIAQPGMNNQGMNGQGMNNQMPRQPNVPPQNMPMNQGQGNIVPNMQGATMNNPALANAKVASAAAVHGAPSTMISSKILAVMIEQSRSQGKINSAASPTKKRMLEVANLLLAVRDPISMALIQKLSSVKNDAEVTDVANKLNGLNRKTEAGYVTELMSLATQGSPAQSSSTNNDAARLKSQQEEKEAEEYWKNRHAMGEEEFLRRQTAQREAYMKEQEQKQKESQAAFFQKFDDDLKNKTPQQREKEAVAQMSPEDRAKYLESKKKWESLTPAQQQQATEELITKLKNGGTSPQQKDSMLGAMAPAMMMLGKAAVISQKFEEKESKMRPEAKAIIDKAVQQKGPAAKQAVVLALQELRQKGMNSEAAELDKFMAEMDSWEKEAAASGWKETPQQ